MTDEKTLKPLIEHELIEANKVNPPFNSNHEAWAVMLEEYQEACEDMNSITASLKVFWIAARADVNTKEIAQKIYKSAVHLTAEAIQVAAMALKAMEVKGNDREIL